MSSASLSSKICFNPECAEFKTVRPRTGWRLRTGEFAELCDRCGSAYEEGRFCETYHLKASGWRCCESCGKRVHCGCIVSAFAFVLLDAGGIECLSCARKNVDSEPNLSRPPSFFFQPPIAEKLEAFTYKNCSQSAGPAHVACWQAPKPLNPSIMQSDLFNLQPAYEAGVSTSRDGTSAALLEKKELDEFPDKLMNRNMKLHIQDVFENGKAGFNSEKQPGCLNTYQLRNSLKNNPSTAPFAFSLPCTALHDTNGKIGFCGTHVCQTLQSLPAKHFRCDLNNGVGSQCENQIQNVRLRVDSGGKHCPRFTDQDLQNPSMDSQSTLTPLFEKMLSASDAGRIGRLVLPKKCAEAYLPPISQPEGLPLKVQDSMGKDWMFQFRYWPNNNSRMYVLEGVTPCIQKMQLQAGDIVTFSRLDPEGKLIMGFRKASVAPSSKQDSETANTGNGFSTNEDAELADSNPLPVVDKSFHIAKEALGTKPTSRKRKSSTLGLKSKRLRLESEDLIELKITWEEAQGLIQPPFNHSPTIVVVEGIEFEEYEEAPILGKPTVFATADMGSSCSAAQNLAAEQFENMQLRTNSASRKLKAAKQETEDIDGLDTLAKLAIIGEGGEGLSVSAQATTKHPRHRLGCTCIVCIQPPSGKGPKHEPTCTCSVCQSVKRRFRTMMLRREKKQSEKEESTSKKQLKSPSSDEDAHQCSNDNNNTGNNGLSQKSDDDHKRFKSSASLFKGQIDLNIQPERDEESPRGSDSIAMRRLLNDEAIETVFEQQTVAFLSHSDSVINQGNSDKGLKPRNDGG